MSPETGGPVRVAAGRGGGRAVAEAAGGRRSAPSSRRDPAGFGEVTMRLACRHSRARGPGASAAPFGCPWQLAPPAVSSTRPEPLRLDLLVPPHPREAPARPSCAPATSGPLAQVTT